MARCVRRPVPPGHGGPLRAAAPDGARRHQAAPRSCGSHEAVGQCEMFHQTNPILVGYLMVYTTHRNGD